MLDPAPTTRIDPTLTRGTIDEVVPATATKLGYVVLTVPNTDYRLHLQPHDGDLSPYSGLVGQKVIGTVRVQAKRLDSVGAGGRFVEPCFGRPRRVQGMVRSVDPATNTVCVSAGIAVHLEVTAPGQSAEQFVDGDFLTCGVLDGASFELIG